jgi:hypothetical protein
MYTRTAKYLVDGTNAQAQHLPKGLDASILAVLPQWHPDPLIFMRIRAP